MVLYAANIRCAPRSGRREPTVANEPFLQVRGWHSAENIRPTLTHGGLTVAAPSSRDSLPQNVCVVSPSQMSFPNPRRADGRRSCSSFASSPTRARFSPDTARFTDPRRADVQGPRLFFGRRRTKPGIYQSLTIPVTHGGLTPAAPADVRVYIADGAICSEHPLYTQERSA
jgi:hypothetical protein